MAQRLEENVGLTLTRLEYARRLAGVSQEQLAQEYRIATGTKTSTQTIGSWCRASDHREPTVSEMATLSGILNAHLEESGAAFRLDYLPFYVSLVEGTNEAPVTIQVSSRWFTQRSPDLRKLSLN